MQKLTENRSFFGENEFLGVNNDMNPKFTVITFAFISATYPIIAEQYPNIQVENDLPFIQYDSNRLLTTQHAITGTYTGTNTGDRSLYEG